ncbi:MAG: hypothetical protein HRU19_13730 [Pseudobacteriovorax sp.]|nr:hypothetical protein [Pseudobacteriovorax sp.]
MTGARVTIDENNNLLGQRSKRAPLVEQYSRLSGRQRNPFQLPTRPKPVTAKFNVPAFHNNKKGLQAKQLRDTWFKKNPDQPRHTLAAYNLWHFDDMLGEAPRIFVTDFTKRYDIATAQLEDYMYVEDAALGGYNPVQNAITPPLQSRRVEGNADFIEADRVVVGQNDVNKGEYNMPWRQGPSSGYSHLWPNHRITLQRLLGSSTGSETQASIIVQEIAAVENKGAFDCVQGWDKGTLSGGPYHFILAEDGEHIADLTSRLQDKAVSKMSRQAAVGSLARVLRRHQMLYPEDFKFFMEDYGVSTDDRINIRRNHTINYLAFNRESGDYENPRPQRVPIANTPMTSDEEVDRALSGRHKYELDYMKSWHWFYRFIMLNRCSNRLRESYYDEAVLWINNKVINSDLYNGGKDTTRITQLRHVILWARLSVNHPSNYYKVLKNILKHVGTIEQANEHDLIFEDDEINERYPHPQMKAYLETITSDSRLRDIRGQHNRSMKKIMQECYNIGWGTVTNTMWRVYWDNRNRNEDFVRARITDGIQQLPRLE